MYEQDNRSFISLDLGTTNILAYVSGQGLVYNQPSLMAYDVNTNKIIAMGNQAYEMLGKIHDGIRMVTPLVDGVIADMDAAKDLLRHLFSRLKMMNIWKDSVILLACPSGVTELERQALKHVAKEMGASLVIVEEEIKMAALGAGINVELPQGNLIMDIGGGTTDIAIISSGDVIVSRSIKIAGKQFDEEIKKFIRSEYNIQIGDATAEQIKINIGSLAKYPGERSMQIYGRDIISGLPKEALVSAEEIRNVLLTSFSKITDLVIEILEQNPPELAKDIIRNGITVCGGGALIRNLDKYLEQVFQIKTTIAAEPLLTVIDGSRVFEKVIRKRIEDGVYEHLKKEDFSYL